MKITETKVKSKKEKATLSQTCKDGIWRLKWQAFRVRAAKQGEGKFNRRSQTFHSKSRYKDGVRFRRAIKKCRKSHNRLGQLAGTPEGRHERKGFLVVEDGSSDQADQGEGK